MGKLVGMMKLTQYLADNKISPDAFAAMVGATESGVRKWMYGDRVPRPEQMRRIADATSGMVEPNDFILSPEKVA